MWSVLGGRRPGNGAAGGGTFGRVTGAPPAVGWLVGSRGEEVGGGFGGLPRGKTEKRCGEWGGLAALRGGAPLLLMQAGGCARWVLSTRG